MNIKIVLGIIVSLMALAGGVVGVHNYFTTKVEFVETTGELGDKIIWVDLRLEQKIVGDAEWQDQHKIWDIEDRYERKDQPIPSEEKRRIQELELKLKEYEERKKDIQKMLDEQRKK